MGHQFKPVDLFWTDTLGYQPQDNELIHLTQNGNLPAHETQQYHYIEHNTSFESNNHCEKNAGIANSLRFISDQDITLLPIVKFRVLLRNLPESDVERLKKIRRRLQNRNYAKECRNRRLQENLDLRNQNLALKNDLQRVTAERDRLLQERDRFQQIMLELGLPGTADFHQLPSQ